MGLEFNIISDIKSAQFVSENWPTSIVYTGFEIGYRILTGQKLLDTSDNTNPARRAYELYCNSGRHSWDQTAIICAVEGINDLWELSAQGYIAVDDNGYTCMRSGSERDHRFLIAKKDVYEIAEYIDMMMCHGPFK